MPVDGGSRPLDGVDVEARDGSPTVDELAGGHVPVVLPDAAGAVTLGDGIDNSSRLADRVAELEEQVTQLEGALRTQRQISAVVGILAERLGCATDSAWSVLVRLSQSTNIRVREIARVIGEAYDGRGRAEDAELLTRLMASLPDAWVEVPRDRRS